MIRRHRAGRLWLANCLTALVALLPGALTGQGLQNGDFEQPGSANAQPDGWTVTKGKLTLDPQMRRSGRFSGRLDGGSGPGGAYQDIAVTPGRGYQLSGLWRNGDRIAEFDIARVELVWLAAPGGKEVSRGGQVDSGKVVSDWTPFQLGPFVAPASAGAARIRLVSTFGIAAFDQLTLKEVDADTVPKTAPPNSIAAGSAPRNDSPTSPSTGTSAPPEVAAPQIQWFTDIPTGQVVAARTGKRIMVFFYQTGEDLSAYWDRAIFSDRAVCAALSPAYVAIRLDYRLNSAMAERLNAGKPGTLLFYGRDGKAIRKLEDHMSAEHFVEALPD
jgi:hypothetical protein